MRVTDANASPPTGDSPPPTPPPPTIDLDQAAPQPGPRHRLATARVRMAQTRVQVAEQLKQPGTSLTLQGIALAGLMIVALLAGALIVSGDRTTSGRGGGNQAANDLGLPTIGASPSTYSLPATATSSASASPSASPSGVPGPAAYRSWAGGLSTRLAVPEQALAAYAYAERVMTATQPSCRLNWTTLAGIGKIASNHGRAGGATVGADGVSTPKILGPALDGRGGRPVVLDTDLGTLDGDRVYDRAVGPMQFVPAAWRVYGQNADADADGQVDINDIDDAALAAARLLCSGGLDLGTVAGWDDGIKKYNYLGPDLVAIFKAADDYGKKSRGSP